MNQKLIALWDFSGPEGGTRGARGIVKAGTIFETTKERAQQLIHSGKAQLMVEPPAQKRAGPAKRAIEVPESTVTAKPTTNQSETITIDKYDSPEELKYDILSIPQIMQKIEEGVYTAREVLELERASGDPRQTLILKLRKILESE